MPLLSEETSATSPHEDRIFSLLFNEDELTWQTIIFDLVRTEQMNPWDINVGVIADRFIEHLHKIKTTDFRISGKMVLAAALLLKIKSDRLVNEDIVALDNLMNSTDEQDIVLDQLQDFAGEWNNPQQPKPTLLPRTPQPRQRKVSVYDLVEALEEALVVETRRQTKYVTPQQKMKVPEKKKDMTKIINDLYLRMKSNFGLAPIIKFTDLIPTKTKEDMVYTFIPLLHLDTQRKLDLIQKEHFGEISIKLVDLSR